jgi:maltooligosyltrehalose trehalohydrolase
MDAADDGWFRATGVRAAAGDRYAFRLDGEGPWLPDPRSLLQSDGVDRDSEVVDPALLRSASAPDWQGRDLRGAVLYELHVGTFSGQRENGGTFDSAITHLDELVALGIDAIELMPVAPFPGARGWGYDGVGLYGVHAAYGGPAGLRRLVDAAHARGLAVVLDVVHNHLGPAGNHLSQFGPYFTGRHHTPRGEAVNFDDVGSEHVRDFLVGSARQWLLDFGMDGLRLDAVHELKDESPRHFLAELADAVHSWQQEAGRPLTLIAESDLNDPRTVTPTARGGLGMDMQWADDVHHAVHAWISGERQGYYVDFGSSAVLARVLTRVFEHQGGHSTFRGRDWGRPLDPSSPDYDGHSFVVFLEDHDQVGNRATGDRIHQHLSPAQHAAAAALILLSPLTPMLFQGEEWATDTPFRYFTDHDEELGQAVTRGRRAEFAAMGWDDQGVPDPQDPETFSASVLDRTERFLGEHARIWEWYRLLLSLRRTTPELRDGDLSQVRVDQLGEGAVVLHRGDVHVLAARDVGPWRAPRVAEVLATYGEFTTEGEDDRVLAGPGACVWRSQAAATSAEPSRAKEDSRESER